MELLPSILNDFKSEGVEAVAICFLHSYANFSHEEIVMKEVKKLWPEVAVFFLVWILNLVKKTSG